MSIREAMVKYNKSDIIDALKESGVTKGDTVFIHSNIAFFGTLEGVKSKEDYSRAFLEAFLEIIGENGNICVPTFTYSFCRKEPFDPLSTSSKMGIFAEYMRVCTGSVRMADANFSVSVFGKNATELTDDPPEESFGKKSFWQRLYEIDGKICGLNYDDIPTFLHYIEKDRNAPYRFDYPFDGQILKNGVWSSAQFIHFARHLDKPEWNDDVPFIKAFMYETGIVKNAILGRGSINVVFARRFYEVISKAMISEPYILTCGFR